MISYGKQSIEKSDIDAVVKVLKGDWLTQGPYIQKFENDLNNYFGSNYSCAVANGTAALHLTAIALKWGEGDIIITTPVSFLATSNSILYAKATPSFVDINPISFTIDPNGVEEKIIYHKSRGEKVRAIIGVDYAGHPCDWLALRNIADKYNIKLINDNCHAMGAEYKGSKKYALKYADVVIQSYHPVKHITTGEGGAVLTNNFKLYKQISCLRSHGMTKDRSILTKNDGPWYYEMHQLGYNYRITDIQCALGSSQLIKLDSFIKKRRKIAQVYNEELSNCENIIIPQVSSLVAHAYHLYPLQIKFNKNDLFVKMEQQSIKLQVHYIPIHLQPYYKNKFGYNKGDFPISEKFYLQEVSLPIYPNLTENQVELIVRNLKRIVLT